MVDSPPASAALPLTLGARQLLDAGRGHQLAGGPSLYPWLVALLLRNGPMALAMAPELDIPGFVERLSSAIASGNDGPGLPEQELLDRACRHATERGRPAVSEIDLAAVLLALHGVAVPEPRELGRFHRTPAPEPAVAPAAVTTAAGPVAEPQPGVPVAPVTAPEPAMAPEPATAPASTWQPRATEPTPALDRFGRDLTRQAAAGELTDLVGRESEVERIVETLCRRHKRNPILLGEAGTGKTAIVEGFAQRVVRGTVPETLRGIRIVQLQPSTLVAGAGIVGEIETRLKAILEEARQDGIVLFIDEVHAIVGTGGMRGTGDLASLLKPALARGDLACIAATTDDEYRRFIEDDAALERRFTPIQVDELNRDATLGVLRTHRDELGRLRGVEVADDVLRWLVDFAADGLPNRHFPDKAVDLLEQCVANAVVEGRKTVDRTAAEGVARRLVGVPLDIPSRIEALVEALTTRGLADEATTRALADRLAVTMRGLDRRHRRPNAIVAVTGPAADRAVEVAEAIASAIFGNPERVVTLDLGRMTEAHDVAMLVGAPPGYVGYSDRLPIHRIAAQPWSILLCDGVDVAHPEVRDLLAEALEDGTFVDGGGRRILLSEAIVVLVARGATVTGSGPLGFRMPGGEAPTPSSRRPGAGIGPRLEALVDVVIAERPQLPLVANAGRVLAEVVDRFAQAGLALEFGPDMAGWLVDRAGPGGDLEATADRDLLPVLARLVGGQDGAVLVEPGPEGRPVTRPVSRPVAGKATR